MHRKLITTIFSALLGAAPIVATALFGAANVAAADLPVIPAPQKVIYTGTGKGASAKKKGTSANKEEVSANNKGASKAVDADSARRFVIDADTLLYIDAPDADRKAIVATLADFGVSIPTAKRAPRRNAVTLRVTTDSIPGVISDEGYALTVSPERVTLLARSGAGLFYGLQTILQSAENVADAKNATVGSDDDAKTVGAKNTTSGRDVDAKAKTNMRKFALPCVSVTDNPRFAYRGMMLDVSRHFYPVEFVKKQIRAMARFKLNRLHLHLTDAAGWRLEITRYPRLTDFAAWRTHPDWKSWWNGGRQYAERGSADAYGGYYTRDDIRELVEYARVHYITVIPEIEMPSHSEEVLTAYPELSCTHEPYKQADFCPGNEQTFEFLQGVLDEVMELFPSEYIHVGGDEAGKGAWRTCPLCRARMEAEGISDVDGLQNYLFHRIGQYLTAHGRKLIGWDEIIDGEPAAGSAIMSWRGTEGGVRAITRGYRAIMCPGGYCYLDAYQDAPATQPEAIGGYLPLERVYSYEPMAKEIQQCDSTLLYGVQGNLWTEYVGTPEHAEQMLYPRMLALAEVGWSLPSNKDFGKFHQRALVATDFLRENGYNCFDLRSEVGNRPEALAPVEHRARGCKVTYADDAPYFPGYAAGGDSALVDGVRGGWSYGDARWQGFTSDGGLDVTIDLGETTDISYVGADFMQICGPWVYMPADVIISASTDGENFTELARISHNVTKDDGGFSYKRFEWEGMAQARRIRYRARRGEFGGFLFTDEIVVR